MRRSRILEKPVSRLMGLWEVAELQSRVAYQQQILDGGCWQRFNDAIVDTVETGCLFRLELLNFRFEFLDGHRSAVIFGVKRASRCCAKASAFSSVVLHQGSAGACCPSATCLLTGRFGMGCLLIVLLDPFTYSVSQLIDSACNEGVGAPIFLVDFAENSFDLDRFQRLRVKMEALRSVHCVLVT
ncbi:uncharacterized protein LOC117188022 [Drosophila miranda]|nr:uncharacterized protein LOC117188022 [Drosophila miranda]